MKHLLATLLLVSAGTTLSGCITWSQGLAPVRPRYGDAVKQGAPLLEWKAATEPADETRYELTVFDTAEAAVYQASDLTETSHTIGATLAPGRYHWTVRPLYRRGEQWVPGPWNARKYFLFAVVFFQWGSQPYEFHVVPGPG